jgi:hypothetical protein
MTSNRSRKIAHQEYKTRTATRGAFAVRCVTTGKVWVGASPNLDAARNRIWFMLRSGHHRDHVLQAEWSSYGESSFLFEVLETLDPDVPPIRLSDLLKEKKCHWAAHFRASMLL